MAWAWKMNFNGKVQSPVCCETATKYSAILFVNLGEFIIKYAMITIKRNVFQCINLLNPKMANTFANCENPNEIPHYAAFHQGLHFLLPSKQSSGTEIHYNLEIPTCDPLKYVMDNPMLIAFICMGKSIRIQRVNIPQVPLRDVVNSALGFLYLPWDLGSVNA